MDMNSKRIRLWDLPTRLFHWLLVVCVLAAVVSGQIGGSLIDWHGQIGLAVVGLIATETGGITNIINNKSFSIQKFLF